MNNINSHWVKSLMPNKTEIAIGKVLSEVVETHLRAMQAENGTYSENAL